MNSGRFNINVILYSIFIALTSALFFWAWGQEGKIVTTISLGVLWISGIFLLIRYVNETNRNLLVFLQSFQYNDPSVSFNKNIRLPFRPVYDEFNRIIKQFGDLKWQKEIEHQYFENIVLHADTGLLAWDETGKVIIFNQAAKKVLKVAHLGNIDGLSQINAQLAEKIKEVKPGTRELAEYNTGNEIKSIYLRAAEFYLKDKPIRLISLQNIHHELEENEIEAWQKLMKLLVHEIVNSISPIHLVSTALSGKIKSNDYRADSINLKELHDGLNAIDIRSRGLLKFIEDYKQLSELPKPVLNREPVGNVLDSILNLLKGTLIDERIKLECQVTPPDLVISMDRKLIDQVFINVLKNSVYSLSGTSNPEININAYRENERAIIDIADNGCGIPFNIQDYIFMPFFTTRENGSGIGLTLARQIMKLHNGNIRIYSREGEGTMVRLLF